MESILSDPVILTALVVASLLLLALALMLILRARALSRAPTKPARRWPGPLAESLRLVLEGQPDAAAELLKDALEQGADTPALYLALGALMRSAGEPERAAALHRGLTVRRGIDDSMRAEAFRQVALDLTAANRAGEASEAAQEATAIRPTDADLLALDRDLAYEAGDVDRALASHYRRVKVTHQSEPRIEASILAARADRSYREGDKTEARRDIKKALKTSAACARAKFVAARLDSEDGKLARAAQTLQALREQEPGLDALVLPHLATALQAAQEMALLDAVRPAAAAATTKPRFRCSSCAFESPAVRWRCQECGAWERWEAASAA